MQQYFFVCLLTTQSDLSKEPFENIDGKGENVDYRGLVQDYNPSSNQWICEMYLKSTVYLS